MKYSIQLYIGTERLDLFDEDTINITSSIQNIRDIGKVFSDYSQSFSVPASKVNNKIFKHYYNSDIVNGFDGRKKIDATIEINYQPFKTGKIKLDEVQMKGNKAHAYKLTFFGGLVSLKDLLGEDQLEDLTWLSNFNTEYSYLNVRTYLQGGRDFTIDSVAYPDAIITPLISAEQRWFYDTSVSGAGNLAASTGSSGAEYTNMKYAIRLYCIIKAIEKKYNIDNGFDTDIVFSNDFFSTSENDFYNLYMWLHREKGKIEGVTSSIVDTYVNKMANANWYGIYSSGDYFYIGDIDGFRASKYSMQLDLNVSSSAVTFDVFIERNGSVVQSFLANTGSSSYEFTAFDLTTNGNYRIRVQHSATFEIDLSSNIFFTRYDSSGTQTETLDFTADQELSLTFVFDILNNMPKMKVIDFLTGLFKMFNLTAYDNGTEIVVKPLDVFYLEGQTIDITEYVDVSSSTVRPSTLYNQINFKYSDTNALFADNHLEQFNVEWAEEEYNIENKYDGEKYEIIVPFSHHKYERIYNGATGAETEVQWGWSVDKLNDDNTGQPYLGAPLVFYAISQTGTNIRVTDGTTPVDIGNYYIPSNSVALSDTDTNINFKAEFNEYDVDTIFTQTLFQVYHRNYISSVFDPSTRLVNVTAYLPNNVLTKYRLNDKFIVGNSIYNINSVSSDLKTGKSEIELISLIEITGNIVPTTTTTTTTSTTTTTTEAPTTTTTTSTTSTTTTSTTSTTTTSTTTTTAGPVTFTAYATTPSHETSNDSCADTTGDPAIFVYLEGTDTVPAIGLSVYTDSALTDLFVGNDLYIGLDLLEGERPDYSVTINASGEITNVVTCTGFETTTTTTTTTISPLSLGVDFGEGNTACSATKTTYYGDEVNLSDSTLLYTDSARTILASAGYYADDFIWKYWDGTAFTSDGVCPI